MIFNSYLTFCPHTDTSFKDILEELWLVLMFWQTGHFNLEFIKRDCMHVNMPFNDAENMINIKVKC